MKRALLTGALSALFLTSAAHADTPADPTFERGRYLATAGDCAACHTAPQGKPYAGGYTISSPLGVITTTNITPSRQHGIGGYSEAQFARALRQGIRADGARLYPAMPYTSYTQLSDADVHALYVYFMHGVAPVEQTAPATKLPFPFNLRASMAVWNAMFLKDTRFTPDPAKSAQWNRGNYLVGALEHCASCHSPRGVLMQEKSTVAFSGGALGEWYAPNVTSDPISGIGRWSEAELATYLKTGRLAGKAQAAGGMGEAVTHSLSQLKGEDLAAIAAYLKTVPAVRDGADKQPASSYGAPAAIEASLRGAAPVAGPDGRTLYSGLCASCHTDTGVGSRDGVYPALVHNSTVGASRPDNLIAVLLHGVDRTVDGHHVLMPGFGVNSYVQALSNAQLAAVATYVRTAFGPGDSVTEEQVATARAGGAPSPLLLAAQIGMAAAALAVLAGLALLLRRRRAGSVAR